MQRKGWDTSNTAFIRDMALHVSVDGQIVVRTCQSGFLKYHKYQGIESEVEEYMEKWLARRNCEQS